MLSRKTILSVLIVLLTVSISFAKGPFVKGELLVQQTPKASKAAVAKVLKNNGSSVLEELPAIRVKRIRVPEKNFDKVKAALSKNPNFTFVEENFLAQGMLTPSDPSFSSQWHHSTIMSSSAWEMGVGSTAIPIAIIDSGVDPDHPDLAAKLIPGYNFLNYNTDTHDVLGHGTAVAGSAGAIANNATGVAGVAWSNPIMPLVVLDSSNWASYTDISNAIIHAVDNGAKVINISIGGSSYSYTMQNAVNYAKANDVLIFASAANYNTSTPYYPAAYPETVAVAATDSADNKASFSNYGDWITLTAPGVSILTTSNGGGYGYWSGTSFSSPVTTGLAALVWSANPSLSAQQVLDILINSSDDLGATGFDANFGHGRINAYTAMMEVMNFQPEIDNESPSVTLTSPSNNQTVIETVTISANADDNVAVDKVEFFLNGSLLASDNSAPFSTTWDSANAASGTYTIEAKAYDSSGNISPSDAVQTFIEEVITEEPVPTPEPVPVDTDTVAPTAMILSPANGSSIGNKTTVSAEAVDENGIAEIRIYLDGDLQFAKDKSELTWRWNTRKLKSGAYTIRVEAEDPAGNVGIDEIVVYK